MDVDVMEAVGVSGGCPVILVVFRLCYSADHDMTIPSSYCRLHSSLIVFRTLHEGSCSPAGLAR